MSKLFAAGGIAASAVLIVFGIATMVVAVTGRSDVREAVQREQIVGTPDMTPDATEAALAKAGLTDVAAPSCTAAGVDVDTGEKAKCFADYMRIHTLEATGGQTYAEMPRFIGEDGKPTNDEAAAASEPKSGQPVADPQRDLWVTSPALTTAVNPS